VKLPHNKKFGAIMADPAIPFVAWSGKGEGRTPQAHYKCEAFDKIAALPVASVAAQDCFLFLWVPLRSVFLVAPLMERWEFKFSGAAFSWVKLYPKQLTPCMGGGYGTRHNVEICWLGRRGKPERKSKGVRELIVSPRREHSRKPDEVYERIETFCDGPYLELCARQRWPGWTCIGDQVGKFKAAS
jgi:N6-adenosine-specific RNA methylase IME4